MLIESVSVCEIGETLPMQMNFSENKAMAFWGRIVTCQAIPHMDQSRYEIGIEFSDMSETDRKILAEFILSLDQKEKLA